jgi:hypothetical protein
MAARSCRARALVRYNIGNISFERLITAPGFGHSCTDQAKRDVAGRTVASIAARGPGPRVMAHLWRNITLCVSLALLGAELLGIANVGGQSTQPGTPWAPKTSSAYSPGSADWSSVASACRLVSSAGCSGSMNMKSQKHVVWPAKLTAGRAGCTKTEANLRTQATQMLRLFLVALCRAVISRERRIGNMVIRAAFHDSLGVCFAPVLTWANVVRCWWSLQCGASMPYKLIGRGEVLKLQTWARAHAAQVIYL